LHWTADDGTIFHRILSSMGYSWLTGTVAKRPGARANRWQVAGNRQENPVPRRSQPPGIGGVRSGAVLIERKQDAIIADADASGNRVFGVPTPAPIRSRPLP
jgi:hypothetical protein